MGQPQQATCNPPPLAQCDTNQHFTPTPPRSNRLGRRQKGTWCDGDMKCVKERKRKKKRERRRRVTEIETEHGKKKKNRQLLVEHPKFTPVLWLHIISNFCSCLSKDVYVPLLSPYTNTLTHTYECKQRPQTSTAGVQSNLSHPLQLPELRLASNMIVFWPEIAPFKKESGRERYIHLCYIHGCPVMAPVPSYISAIYHPVYSVPKSSPHQRVIDPQPLQW